MTASRPRVWMLVIIGIVGGIFSGTFGSGGGLVVVPLLLTFAGLDHRRASATSLLTILPSTLAGSITYLANGEVDLPAAGIIAIGAVLGSVIGARLLQRLPLPVLRWGFILLLVGVAVRMAFVEPVRGDPLSLSPVVVVAYVVIGLLMGLASGLFGVGGAVIAVPALVAVLGVSDLIAKGTTLAVMVVSSTAGSLTHRRSGLVDVRSALIIGPIAAVAAVGGAYLGLAMTARLSSVLFAALLVMIAAQLTVRALRPDRGGPDAAPAQ
ncbi:MAG: sulfite exporter TauE/SafE family protein [Salinibacterium sp.]|nr:sulfite exporter TauE/SafE family protein [Salinibacterium sp.]